MSKCAMVHALLSNIGLHMVHQNWRCFSLGSKAQ